MPIGRPRTFRRGSSYSANDVERLIDGFIYDADRGEYRAGGGSDPHDDGCYLLIRSRMEVQGDVDSVEFTEMLDVERAIGKLRERYPIAAMVLALSMLGWTPQEIEATFAGKLRTPAVRHFDRGIAYCRAYLSGDDAEAAYMAGKRA